MVTIPIGTIDGDVALTWDPDTRQLMSGDEVVMTTPTWEQAVADARCLYEDGPWELELCEQARGV